MNPILERRAQFLAFLRARLKNEDAAEEILQGAPVQEVAVRLGLSAACPCRREFPL